MRKIIYLDIDGVIVPLLPSGKKMRPAVPSDACLMNLLRLCLATEAEVVVSSSWRVGKSTEQMAKLINVTWNMPEIYVTGVTPVIKTSSPDRLVMREQEITSHAIELLDDDSFVILDDDPLRFNTDPFNWRFVHINGYSGLQNCDVALAINRLETPIHARS